MLIFRQRCRSRGLNLIYIIGLICFGSWLDGANDFIFTSPRKSSSTQRWRLRFHAATVSYDFYGPKTVCKATAGDEVNGFQLEENLGAGAFGTTWRARATNQSDLEMLNLEEGMYFEYVCTAVFQDGVMETPICDGPWDVSQRDLLHKHRTCTILVLNLHVHIFRKFLASNSHLQR